MKQKILEAQKQQRQKERTNADNAARLEAAKVKTSSDLVRVREEAAQLSGTTHSSDFFTTDFNKMKFKESKQNGSDRAQMMKNSQQYMNSQQNTNGRRNEVWERQQESARETTARWLREREQQERDKKNCALGLSESIGNSRPIPVSSNNNNVKKRQNPRTGNQLKTNDTKEYDSSMRTKDLNQRGMIINNGNRNDNNSRNDDSKTVPVGTKTLVDNSNQSIPNYKIEKPKVISRVVSNPENNKTQQNGEGKTYGTKNPAKLVAEKFYQMGGGNGIDISGVESNKWIDVHLDQKRTFQEGGPFQRDENGEIIYMQYISRSYKDQVNLNGFTKINKKQ